MNKSDSLYDAQRDAGLDDQIQQLYTLQQDQATQFEVIWRAAQNKANPRNSSRFFARSQRWYKNLGWQPVAMTAGFLLTLGIVGTLFNAPEINEQASPLSISIDRNDELFQALISSTQWSAPSDIFLKNQPKSAVWGMPTLNIRTTVNAEEVL